MARSMASSVLREAVTVSEWTVRINGADQASVKPGESVEIGRKPLRPLADDGNTRIDIVDQTKSMSKRHALFGVRENGAGYVRDLGSTNGSYVVRDNGDLLRLPANADFLLPTSPMRMQFGDVPADFIRIEESDDTDEHPQVPDLFGYAVGEAPQEPDAADMSVDDILDLRAGEPTAMFSADMVKRKVREDAMILDSLSIPQLATKPEEPAKPRDLFADALSQQSEPEHGDDFEVPGTSASDAGQSGQSDRAGEPGQSGLFAGTPAAGATETSRDEWTRVVPQSARPVIRTSVPDVVPVDAIAHAVTRPAASNVETNAGNTANAVTQPEQGGQQSQSPSGSQQPAAGDARNDSAEPIVTSDPSAMTNPADQHQSSDIVSGASGEDAQQPSDDAAASTQQNAATGIVGNDDPDAAGVYSPAFEPGSVFDRVAKGELKAQEEVIEVDGLTSDDAKRTQDFSMQFEIARHPELLAFLAMNPYLYDDMYAWLAARGEADIDEALAHNKGYQEYREAVGK
ncbi:hypothetical protein DF196_11030 [Bifidobacterium callitrichidarum]|uniref:FHA domain-containing protein n=1 Tax=Bifidobacterium callitrichidarum TaxID=2052941 RepID=A0A2U2N294_9BIFI|nr:hypothetical protein DF196_11030 [Bifidobacterium callitrichidarum]